MYLIEIADKDILFIVLGIVGLALLIGIIFFAFKKSKKVKPISEDERYDNTIENDLKDEKQELTEDQKEAREELNKLLNQMNNDIQKQKEKDPIEDYEKEQEENAVISYKELMKQVEAQKKIEEKEYIQKEEVEYIPKEEISHEEYIPKKEISHEKSYTKEDAINDYLKRPAMEENYDMDEPKKFHQSQIISPIYGIQKEGEASRPSGEAPKHAKTNVKLTGDDSEFLESLKDFRNNL